MRKKPHKQKNHKKLNTKKVRYNFKFGSELMTLNFILEKDKILR